MDDQTVIKAAIRNVVSKGIRDIRRDPNRSIRKLVDLGMQFGKGRIQQSFFNDAQSALQHRNSPYYTLVTSMIRNTDPMVLETMGLNVGYMSWTMGAKIIRAYEKEHGVNIPWTILVQTNSATDRRLDLDTLVSQGQKLGIYTYFLFTGRQSGSFANLLSTAERYRSSAFFLFSEDGATNTQLASLDNLPPNALIIPRDSGAETSEIGNLLVQKKRMFGLNCEYNASNVAYYLSDAFLQSVASAGFPFLFLIPAPGCDAQTCARVNAEVLSLRTTVRYPLFPIDLYRDVLQVDHIISDERCMLILGADGAVRYPCNAEALNVSDMTLEHLLRQTMPGVRRYR